MNFKSIIFLFLFFQLSVSFAQEKMFVTVASKSAILEGKSTGKFMFIFPEGISKEDVDKSAAYYIHNFTVNYDVKTKVAEINMVSNDERSRRVIVRFLSACGIQKINLEGNLLDLFPFYESYLK
jgi:hypothetical protein